MSDFTLLKNLPVPHARPSVLYLTAYEDEGPPPISPKYDFKTLSSVGFTVLQ